MATRRKQQQEQPEEQPAEEAAQVEATEQEQPQPDAQEAATPDPIEGLLEELEVLDLPTQSARIRWLAANSPLSRGDIARLLGIRYQSVRQALVKQPAPKPVPVAEPSPEAIDEAEEPAQAEDDEEPADHATAA